MDTRKLLMIVIVVLGGIAVLGSYVYGFQASGGETDLLWGGVPESLRPVYAANMIPAAIGFLVFTYYIIFRLKPAETKIGERDGFGVFNWIYAAILIPSALWMPFTLQAVEQNSPAWAWAVRLDLAIVGLASLAMLYALWKVRPRQSVAVHRLAMSGSIFMCIQTVILDAIIWSAFFLV
jgi:hypothetical protein